MAKKTSLGVTNDLNDIDVKDLLNNETAINMLLHENQKSTKSVIWHFPIHLKTLVILLT